jgi:hypothetical protein
VASGWLAAWLVVQLSVLGGCASPAPPPTPTAPTPAPAPSARPAVAPTPSPPPAADLGDDPDEAAAVFLDSLQSVIDEASVMAEASCDDLKLALVDNPAVFRSVRGYAATLKRVAAQSPDLSEDEAIKATLADLDTTMGQLDGALSLCGISLN